jgi:hypothetical protein
MPNNIKITPALIWLGHALEVLAFGAIVAGSIAGYQTVASGTYNLTSVGGVVLSAILASLLKGGGAAILSNVNFPQALQDGLNDLKILASQPQAQAPQGPLHVVVHQQALPVVEPQPIILPTVNKSVLPPPDYGITQVALPPLPGLRFGDTSSVPIVQP